MHYEKLAIPTKTNSEGRVTVKNEVFTETPEHSYKRDDKKTPFENFDGLTTKLLRVPKEEVDEKRAEQEKARERKQD